MARPATSPSARLATLAKAEVKAAKLKRGQILTAAPMSELLGVRWPALRDWCNDIPGFAESKAFEPGGNGIEWSFKAVATVRFLKAHFAKEQAKRSARAKRVRQIIGGDDLANAPDDLSLDELAKMVRLSTDFQEARVRSGKLVDVDRLEPQLRNCFSEMQQAGMRCVQQMDPTGSWLPETRTIVENVTRSILLAQQRAAEDCLAGLNGGTA